LDGGLRLNPALLWVWQASGMSVALPIVRFRSDEASGAPLTGLGLAAIAIFLFALSTFSPKVLGDGDTWSHLATGEWIIAHRTVPRADPFSHSMPGAPWTAHEWLSEILLTLAFRVGGGSGCAVDRRRRGERGADRGIERSARTARDA